MSQPMTRRRFVASAAAGAAAMLTPLSRVRGANDDIRLGFVGLGGRGSSHTAWFTENGGARVAAVCDPDPERIAPNAQKHPQAQAETDVRRLIENKDIDAIVIACCNHWHCLAAVWAVQAGKDVYVEKPISHNVWEGRKLVEAARKHKRIAQGGTQMLSDPFHAEVKAFLDSGAIGKMQYVRLHRFGVRGSIGKRATPLEVPSHIDYDLWLGPAQDEPLYREKFHYDWHWDWNTGNGDLGNWCSHIIADARHVAFRDQAPLPRRVISGGGRFVWDDAGQTPNTQFVYYDTGIVPVVLSVHNLPARKGTDQADTYRRLRSFMVIQCEGGYYAGTRGGGEAYDNNDKVIKKFKGDGGRGHAANFLAAMRSRKPHELNAEIEQSHYTAAWCHLGNISYRLGGQYSRGEALERVKGYAPWQELVNGFEEHARANEIDLEAAGAALGPMLEVDTERETLIGPTATAQAKAMLTRKYREPFSIPNVV